MTEPGPSCDVIGLLRAELRLVADERPGHSLTAQARAAYRRVQDRHPDIDLSAELDATLKRALAAAEVKPPPD